MNSSLTLNPMTFARPVHKDGEAVALNLYCYAQRRSLHKTIRIERTVEPVLFQIVLDWLNGSDPPSVSALALGRAQELRFWSMGLLISPDEWQAVPPGARPEISEGHAAAAALSPQVAGLLRYGPGLTGLPEAPDRDFANLGYCSVPRVIGLDDLAALNAFYSVLLDGDWLAAESKSGRCGIGNDPATRRVQSALTPYFSALLGQDIVPSYTFAREYSNEAALQRHTDRDECEFTFSLYVDYQPGAQRELCPWPLIVHAPGGDVAANQTLGGGIIMRGQLLPHSRPALPPGHRARMAFLHYVSKSTVDAPA